MLSKVKIKIKFCSNFTVNINEHYKENEDVLKIIKKKNKKVLCKNFLFFLCFLKKFEFIKNLSFFVFPTTSRDHKSVLRPPYKNKISRHPLGFMKWNFILTFNFLQKEVPSYNNLMFFFNDVQLMFNIFSFFQTNIALQKFVSIKYVFYMNDNFIFINF